MSPRPAEILLVEDDPGDALLVREALESTARRSRLHVVADGVLALEWLRDPRHRRPDLVLLDLNLPRKDGREVLADIRADPDLTHLPVVVLTTSGAEADISRTYALHANAYLQKPVDADGFTSMVAEIEHFFLDTARLPPRPAA